MEEKKKQKYNAFQNSLFVFKKLWKYDKFIFVYQLLVSYVQLQEIFY